MDAHLISALALLVNALTLQEPPGVTPSTGTTRKGHRPQAEAPSASAAEIQRCTAEVENKNLPAPYQRQLALEDCLRELQAPKAAKAQAAAAKRRREQDEAWVKAHPDKDPKWLLSKAGQVWKQHPTWDVATCDGVARREVWIGMTSEQVIASLGRPNHINSDIAATGTTEQWVYGGDYIYIEAGKVTHLQTRR